MRRKYFLFFIVGILALKAESQSVFELVRGSSDVAPADYYRIYGEADRFYEQRDYPKAAEAFGRLTRAYPWNGEIWRRFGVSLYNSAKYREAADAFLKADKFGISFGTQFNALMIARSFARAGEADIAIGWLERTFGPYRFDQRRSIANDSAFSPLKDNPRFIRLTGAVPRKFTRDEGWRYDVDFLLAEIRRVNPIYSKQPLPDELLNAANRLKTQISKLTDAQILLELQHLLVLLRQSHNNILPSAQDKVGNLTQLPVQFYIFPEGLFVVDAAPPYEDLIGSRVLRFDETSAERALEAMEYVISGENKMEVAWKAPDRLKIPQWLHALKLTADPERVKLTVLDRSGKTRTISPQPISLSSRPKLSAPRLHNLPEVPLFLSRPDDAYWFEHLPRDKTVYLQYNQVENKPEESLEKFGLRLRAFLAGNDVRNLIIDVRRNNGGSTFLDAELLRTLITFDSKNDNKLFVLIGRWTFSAAGNFITDVDRLTRAVFVGEPSGAKPLLVGGDESSFVLPFSGVAAALSSTSWELRGPRDSRLWIAPEIPIALTAQDYFANRDTVLETVLTMVRDDSER